MTYSIFLFEPEESLADKTINDSAIEISPPALEKKEEEKDHGVADKPDVEAVEPAIGGESAVVVEDTPKEMSHTQVDGTHVGGEWRLAWVVEYRNHGSSSEAKDVPAESEGAVAAETDPLPREESDVILTTEAQELPKAPADEETGATEQVEIDQVIEGQPQAEVTAEVLVAEVNEPDGRSSAVGGVDQEETAHEAEPVAAEINNVGDGTHEAVVVDDEPTATVAVEEANGNEATLEQLDEQPEVTVHVETAPFVEEPQADEVAAATVVEEPSGEGVPASVDVEQAVEEARGEVGGEDIPAVVEAVPVNEAVAEDSQASVVSEETPAVGAAIEETTDEAEPVVQIAESGPAEVAIETTPDPVEPDPTVREEVASAPVEAEVASEESPAPVMAEDVPEPSQVEVAETSVSVEATREETTVAESAVEKNPASGEPGVEIAAAEETPAQGEAEPVVGVTTTEETPAPIEAEPVVSEESAVVVEVEPTDEVATTNETPAPIEAEPAHEVTTNETPESLVVVEAEPTVEDASGAEPVVEVTTSDETPAPVEAEPVVAEETPVAVEAAPVYSEETLAPVKAEHVIDGTAGEAPFTDSTIDISREEALAPVEAELIASETRPADTEPTAEVTEEATPVAVEPSAEAVDAIPTPETVDEETSTAAEPIDGEGAPAPAPIEAEPVTEAEEVTEPSKAEPALVDVGSEAVNTPVGEEVVIRGSSAAVADAESEITVEPMLKDRGVFGAGIKNDTEVALEDASVALATNSVKETSPAVSSESTQEPNVEAVLEEQPTTESGHLSAAVSEPSIKEDVQAEEQQEEPVEDAVVAEPLAGLKTEDLYIQTSLDTTTFTPIVDSGIDVCMNHSWISISLTRRSSRSQNHNPRVYSALPRKSNDRNRLGHLSK